MLTLSHLRPLRSAKGVTRANLSALTDITESRLRDLELRTHEPWFDEALLLAQALCLGGITPLIVTDHLSLSTPTDHDIAAWRSAPRVPLTLAWRIAHHIGLSDPFDLPRSPLLRQLWDAIAANDRHPEFAGICPWCAVDIAAGGSHLPTCIPDLLWGAPVAITGPLPVPEIFAGREAGIPARSLKHYRLASGQRQKDLADMLGISANHYARLERGDAPLMRGLADKLAAHYCVTREALYADPEVG